MPDISMCLNKTCPLRHTCYRFRAIPSDPQQTYAAFTFSLTAKPVCPDYSPLRAYDKVLDRGGTGKVLMTPEKLRHARGKVYEACRKLQLTITQEEIQGESD